MIDSLDYAPDGSRVVSGGFDKTLRVWDVGTGRQLGSIGTPDAVTAVNFSPDGASAATGFHNGQVILWDLETGRDVQHFIGHTRGTDRWKTRRILAVAFSPDGSQLASGGDDAMVRVWDVATGEQSTALKNNGTPIESIAWASDGKRLLSSEYDGSMTWWDVESGDVISQSSPDKADRWTALSPDDRRIVSRTGILDAKTFQLVRRLENVDDAAAIEFRYSNDGRFIVAGSGSGLVRVWDAETGGEVARFEDQIGQASVVAVSPNGRVAFGAGGYWSDQQKQFVRTGDFELRLWQLSESRVKTRGETNDASTSRSVPLQRETGILTNPPAVPTGGLPTGEN